MPAKTIGPIEMVGEMFGSRSRIDSVPHLTEEVRLALLPLRYLRERCLADGEGVHPLHVAGYLSVFLDHVDAVLREASKKESERFKKRRIDYGT